VTAFDVDSYRELASILTPLSVSQYLAAQEWELESRQADVREIWRPVGNERARIMLPLATDYVDFRQRFRDALYALGRINDWDPHQLQENIAAAHADRFFVRFDQHMPDGTISFRQAESSVDAIYKMLKAAATTAADPTHSHLGRRPAVVTDFLDENVRLGHTKAGSFVFTVLTRLGDPLPESSGSQQSSVYFARRAMETLATGLTTTRRLTRLWDPQVLESLGELGLSAGLVESLEELAQPEELRAVDLSFEWAVSEPRPGVGNEPIVLDREAIMELPRVRERLVQKEEPRRRETIVGTVKSLTRDDSDDEQSGSVVLFADVNGRSRNVHVSLGNEDHLWAIKAYEQRLPFTVTGDLVFERRVWRLTGDIEVDSSFLRYRAGEHD